MQEQKQIEKINEWKKSPIAFIRDMWNLTEQPLIEGRMGDQRNDYKDFIKGKHITWQQTKILQAVEKALQGGKKRISVKSGHGIGKSCVLAWLVVWFLFCHKDAQVPCTAPSSNQMHDVLWKELSKWIQKLPKGIKELYDWTANYLRITESPETWFARAKTAKKEAPEALAGIHGDHVLFIIDESSGVPEEVFNTAEGALTEENILVIMISNPTRTTGYFYQSHTSDKSNWNTLSFNSENSPIVDNAYVKRIIGKHGKDSDEYRIRVKGEFPNIEAMDDKGFVPLFTDNQINLEPISEFVGDPRLGVDPSGEGSDKTAWLGRDNFKAQVLGMESISNSKTIARGTMTWMAEHKIDQEDVMVDSFGVGSDVGKELALSDFHYAVGTVNVGDNEWDNIKIDDLYLNLRAMAYFEIKKWFRQGGSIMDNNYGRELKKELLTIKYKRNIKGKIQIMSKVEMKREGIASPNFADALMLTFIEPEIDNEYEEYEQKRQQQNKQSQHNEYGIR